MNRFIRTLVVAVALPALIVPATGSAQGPATGSAQDSNRQLQTDLSGFNEVHAPSLSPTGVFNAGTGSIFSTGNGQLELKIDKQNRQIEYELTYAFPDINTPVVGTQFVNQAHLHFGQKHTTGGIPVWLCHRLTMSPRPPQWTPHSARARPGR